MSRFQDLQKLDDEAFVKEFRLDFENAQEGSRCNCDNCERYRRLTVYGVGPAYAALKDIQAMNREMKVGDRVPYDSATRKRIPVVTGLLDLFPNALQAVAEISEAGRKRLGHDTIKLAEGTADESFNALGRHLLDRGTLDTDGARHSAKIAWRALEALERELTS